MSPEALADSSLQVIDLRSWQDFRRNHLPGALWTKTGAFFCASIGSYVTPENELALICREADLDRLQRSLMRIGLDKLVGWCSIEAFEARIAEADAALGLVETREMTAETLKATLDSGASLQILDVRRGDEFEAGHLDGAVNIPHTRLMEAPDRVPGPAEDGDGMLVHCLAGVRSATACSALQRDGHEVINLAGGWGAWRKVAPTEPAKRH